MRPTCTTGRRSVPEASQGRALGVISDTSESHGWSRLPCDSTFRGAIMWINAMLLTLSVGSATEGQAPNCVPPSNQQLIIYRAGSLTRAFQELEKVFTCRTGIQVKDSPMGSVDAGRQITAGGHPCDLYAPADYLDIDLFMKPPGYADFNIEFAQGRMVLAYSAKGLA